MLSGSPTSLAFYEARDSTGKKRVLIAEILAAVRLPEAHDTRGIQPAGLGGAPRRDAEPERHVGHAEDHATGMLRAVFGPATYVGFADYFIEELASFDSSGGGVEIDS